MIEILSKYESEIRQWAKDKQLRSGGNARRMRQQVDNAAAQRLITRAEPQIRACFSMNTAERRWGFAQECSMDKMAAVYNHLVNPPQTGDAMSAATNEIVAAETQICP